MRVVGIDSLTKLLQVKEKSAAEATVKQIRELLRPFEYTRVDRIIDVVFDTATDVEQASEAASREASGVAEGEGQRPTGTGFTSTADLAAMRERIIQALGKRFGAPLIRRRPTLYETPDSRHRACISLSKRYDREYQPYWYAFHPAWRDFLVKGEDAVHVLGCMDRDVAYAIPFSVLDELLPKLNQTVRDDGKTYWHIVMTTQDSGALALYSSPTGETVGLQPFEMRV